MNIQEKKQVYLVPECGGEAGTDFIYWCKKTYPDAFIIGVDCLAVTQSAFSCDIFYQVPESSDEGFASAIGEIIGEYGVTHVLPTFEYSIEKWKDIVEQYDLLCTISFAHALLFKDKYKTREWCQKHKVKTIETGLLKDLPENRSFDAEQPLYLKPRCGNGSKDNFSSANKRERELLTPYLLATYGLDAYIVQPFTTGQYWSVDLFVNHDGAVISVKKVTQMQGSKITLAEGSHDEKVTAYVASLARKGQFRGMYNIELIQTGTEIKLLEINVRTSGSTIYSVLGGVNFYESCMSGDLPEQKTISTQRFCKNALGKTLPAVSGVKVLLENESGDVVLTKRDDVPFWTIPGGGVETGESLIEAGKREVREELCYLVEELEKCCTVTQQGKTAKSYELYRGLYDGSQLIGQPGEVAQVGLFSKDALPYPIDSVSEGLIKQTCRLPYYKNVRIDYGYERSRVMQRPLQGVKLLTRFYWNKIVSGSYKG